MADNFTTKDAAGVTRTLAALDVSSVHFSKQVSVSKEVAVTMTRTADTNAYAANDAITTATSGASAFTFSDCGLINGAGGTIVDAMLILSNPNAVKANFELWLFINNPTIPDDNAAFAFSDSEANDLACVLKFYNSDYSDSSNNRAYHMWNAPRMFKCDSDDNDLYGVLKTNDAFTPASAETYRVKLKIVQDT